MADHTTAETITPRTLDDPDLDAPRCPDGKACLDGGDVRCRAIRPVSKTYLFVDGRNGRKGCPYAVGFGTRSTVCTCPVRNAIYRYRGR